jgi:serine/threonine protein kinase
VSPGPGSAHTRSSRRSAPEGWGKSIAGETRDFAARWRSSCCRTKLLSDATPGDRDQQERLLREARTIAALNHPHICAVHDVGEADGVAYMAMELVEGETLQQAIRRGRFPVARACRIGRQLADALEYAHTRGVVHRDFKSANAMLMPDGRATVLDFGIARRSIGESSSGKAPSSGWLRTKAAAAASG